MGEPTVRDQIKHVLEELSPDATFEDAIERLVLLAKIDAGLAELDAGEGVSPRRSQATPRHVTTVIWSPQAIRDVESIRAFIAQDSPSYADLEARRIVAASNGSARFPSPVVPFLNDKIPPFARSSRRRIESSTGYGAA